MTTFKERIDETVSSLSEKAATVLTKALLKDSDNTVDPNQIKAEFISLLNIKKEEKRIKSGFENIFDYLHRHCSPVEIESVKHEWSEGVTKLTASLQETRAPKEEDLTNTLQNIMGISDKSYELFYTAGRELYEHGQFKEAADVFFTIALLNGLRYNVWLSLGMSEQKCGHLQEALNAFAMAIFINMDSPEPYIYSANCCVAMGNKHEAELYLDEVSVIIEKEPIKYASMRKFVSEFKKFVK